MRKRYIKPSIVGGAVSLIAVLVVYLALSGGNINQGELWSGALASIILGVSGGYLVEWLIERYESARDILDASLRDIRRYSLEMHKEVHASTLLLCSIVGIPNAQEPVQKWALKELVKHFEKIPIEKEDANRARAIFCRYLRGALEAAGKGSTWLGIHEDTVSFFTAENHARERSEYINALNNHSGKKYRVFVEGPKNKNELSAPEVVDGYLKLTAGKNVESFLVTRTEFNNIVRPPVGRAISDWALYGEKVLLEFDVEKNLVLFHIREESIRGMRRLLEELQRRGLERRIGIESIDADYVKKLREQSRPSIEGEARVPEEAGSGG